MFSLPIDILLASALLVVVLERLSAQINAKRRAQLIGVITTLSLLFAGYGLVQLYLTNSSAISSTALIVTLIDLPLVSSAFLQIDMLSIFVAFIFIGLKRY